MLRWALAAAGTRKLRSRPTDAEARGQAIGGESNRTGRRDHRRLPSRRTEAARHQHLSNQLPAEVRGLKYKNVAAELRPKQEPLYSIKHELRSIAIFLVAAVRAGHNKFVGTTAPKGSKR